MTVRVMAVGVLSAVLVLASSVVIAQKKYDPGASDSEIKVGNIMPYSGPASTYGTIGRTGAAYFQKINDEGGINGRKIVFVSLDDGYSPPKTVEAARKLVEQEEVLLIFNSLGTAPNTAIHTYMNAKKVPHLFVSTGASKWNDPKGHPWTMGWIPSYQSEAKVFAQHILQTAPNAKVAILYQNDDFGKDYLEGLKTGLGAKKSMIVAEASYEATDPTVNSQIVTLQASGATVFVNISLPKAATQAIRKAYDIGWKPTQYLTYVSGSITVVLKPAGVEKSAGIITTGYQKNPTDPTWTNDAGMMGYFAFMKKYYPLGDAYDTNNANAYSTAQTLVEVLKRCRDNLSRENVMRQAASLTDLELPLLLPGVRINTGPTDYAPIQSMRLQRFDGQKYVPISDIMSVK